MEETSLRWIWGGLMGIVGLLGLFMAAGAEDFHFELTGLLLFLVGVLYNFALIKRSTGHPNRK